MCAWFVCISLICLKFFKVEPTKVRFWCSALLPSITVFSVKLLSAKEVEKWSFFQKISRPEKNVLIGNFTQFIEFRRYLVFSKKKMVRWRSWLHFPDFGNFLRFAHRKLLGNMISFHTFLVNFDSFCSQNATFLEIFFQSFEMKTSTWKWLLMKLPLDDLLFYRIFAYFFLSKNSRFHL